MKCEQCKKQPARRRFCSNQCKDRWHNLFNARGYGLISHNFSDDRTQHEIDMDEATVGWDEGGWISDESGCST